VWSDQLATFPGLTRDGNVLFTDAISQAVYTHESVPMLLTGITGWQHLGAPNWLHFAKASGCTPVWLTMNDIGTPYLGLAEHFDNRRVPPGMRGRDDGDLVPKLKDAVAKHPKLCAVVHLMGAHNEYVERYPASFRPHPEGARGQVMHARPEEREAYRTAYRHAVAYSMHVVAQLIDVLANEPARAMLIYTPDHAENLWDDERKLYLHGFGTRAELAIPLHVWASPNFRQTNPTAWRNLEGWKRFPVSNAQVLPTLLDAMAIQQPREDSLLRPPQSMARTVHIGSLTLPYERIR